MIDAKSNHDRLREIRAAGLCYLCGEKGPDTSEHVIPRCFYPDALPNDTLALPAHRSCNQFTHLDEEAFRDFIAGAIPPTHPSFGLWAKTWRSIHRDGAKKRLRGYYRSILTTRKRGDSGDLEVHPVATTLSHERANRVLAKIVRGLHYVASGQLLPPRGVAWNVHQLRRDEAAVPCANRADFPPTLSVRWDIDNVRPVEGFWLVDICDGKERFSVSTALAASAEEGDVTIDWPAPGLGGH